MRFPRATRLLIAVAPRGPVELLAEPQLREGVHGALGPGHRRLRRPGLGRRELQLGADVDHGLPDPRRAVGEVQVGSPQAQRLTATETAGGDDLEQRTEPVGLGVQEERGELDRGPRCTSGRAPFGGVTLLATLNGSRRVFTP